MNYDKVKLGLFDRFKVWIVRRVVEEISKWRNSFQDKVSEVDYSTVNEFKKYLLEQRIIRKATRDAKRQYKRTYGKNNDGVSEAAFIENYLKGNGLKQSETPKQEPPKNSSFMEKYPTGNQANLAGNGKAHINDTTKEESER